MEGTPARLFTAPRMMRVNEGGGVGIFRQINRGDHAHRNDENGHQNDPRRRAENHGQHPGVVHVEHVLFRSAQ